jgi:hypothetical protein
MSMEDLSGTFEVTLFPEAYSKFAPITRESGPFIVEGVVDEQFGVCSLTAHNLELADSYMRRLELAREEAGIKRPSGSHESPAASAWGRGKEYRRTKEQKAHM